MQTNIKTHYIWTIALMLHVVFYKLHNQRFWFNLNGFFCDVSENYIYLC